MPPKAVAKQEAQPPAVRGGSKITSVLGKLAEGSAAEWDQDEVLDLVYWLRQVLGIALGLAWAYLQAPGLGGFVCFLGINLGLAYVLCRNVMGLDEDAWENSTQEILTEGVPFSMSAFVVTWVIAHNIFHL